MQQNAAPNRRYDRYYIGQVPGLRARAFLGDQEIRIATLSAGGCGFLQKKGQYQNGPREIVECHFESEELGSLSLQAEVIYIRRVSILNDEAHYYGLKFGDSKVDQVSEFIENLISSAKGPHLFLV